MVMSNSIVTKGMAIAIAFTAADCTDVEVGNTPRLRAQGQVQHLETPIRATLRQAGGILGWVETLHPTPAVGGWPRPQALAFLAEHEGTPRGLYAAPLGWLTAGGDGMFAVALRSALLQANGVQAFAGAGIVAASSAEAEWRETEMKLNTVAQALRCQPAA